MDAWYPPATRRPVPNTASPHPGEGHYLYEAAGPFTTTPIGWVLHVVIGNGSPYGTFLTAKSPERRFSHLWVSKTGAVEQYGPLTHKSWATGAANTDRLSVETEGFPTEPLTAAQVDALAKFHVWTGLPDTIATTPGQGGVTCHYIGGAAWGGHSCPDPQGQEGKGPRSKQRAAIIARAQQLRTGDDMTPDECRAVVQAELKAILGPVAEAVWAAKNPQNSAWGFLVAAATRQPPAPPTAADIAAAVAAQFKTLPAGTAVVDDATIARLSKAVWDEGATRLVR